MTLASQFDQDIRWCVQYNLYSGGEIRVLYKYGAGT